MIGVVVKAAQQLLHTIGTNVVVGQSKLPKRLWAVPQKRRESRNTRWPQIVVTQPNTLGGNLESSEHFEHLCRVRIAETDTTKVQCLEARVRLARRVPLGILGSGLPYFIQQPVDAICERSPHNRRRPAVGRCS